MNIIINDMINLRKSILGLAALIVAFGLVFTASAFTKKVALVKYQYTENTMDNLFDDTKWDDVTVAAPASCGDPGDLPCIIEFDSEVYADIEDFLESNNDLTSLRPNSTEISSKEILTP